ncbi:GH36 C-terminal domain-containing protein [Streptomyces sp. NPDC052687]|uniref:GH36 C-terminal domain-containing protein n=1 Tax=Streptomyces sp. NPDC052687 TaxID=3154759 RepID=UPI003437335B
MRPRTSAGPRPGRSRSGSTAASCTGPLFAPAHRPLRLRGLDPRARYRDEDTGAEWSGATLTGFGRRVPELPRGDRASALVRLRRTR